MSAQLITWLKEQRGDRSIRSQARDLGLSHAYLSDVLRGINVSRGASAPLWQSG